MTTFCRPTVMVLSLGLGLWLSMGLSTIAAAAEPGAPGQAKPGVARSHDLAEAKAPGQLAAAAPEASEAVAGRAAVPTRDDAQAGSGEPPEKQELDLPVGGAATPDAAGTPLNLRHTPLETKAEESSGWGYKLLLLSGLLALAAWLLFRRKKSVNAASESALEVLSRTSIGARSELLVVEVAGRKLLLGVTSTAIQLLGDVATSTAPSPEPTPSAEPVLSVGDGESPDATINAAQGFGKALGNVERRLARYVQAREGQETPARQRATTSTTEDGEQARSLLRLAR